MATLLREHARAIWQAGVDAVAAGRLVRRALSVRGNALHIGDVRLPLSGIRSIAVVGAGKAGAAMGQAVEAALGHRIARAKRLHGCVNVPDRSIVPLDYVQLHAARSAPDNKPTEAGVEGARRIGSIVESLGPQDLALCLISGGGSALLPAPAPGITLAEKQIVTSLLHASGATIVEMNAVRKHLSELKGGGLIRRFHGKWLASLIISDVVGDPLDVIASGPTAADQSTYQQAIAVLRGRGLWSRAPRSVRHRLQGGAAGKFPETLKQLPANVTNAVIGNNATALSAAAKVARRLGYRVLNLSSFIEGETRQAAIVLAGIVRGIREQHWPFAPPACVLSGGETTVTLDAGSGLGGRNQEFVLSALNHLGYAGLSNAVILSGGTDGEDGPTDAAGAIGDQQTLWQAQQRQLEPAQFLERHDSYHFFDACGGLIKTGLTNTNVMDLRVLLIGAA
jgi:hydroxypyruvate reductase/glycerate 2-kinase